MFTCNPDERYNTLDDRLYGTSNINTVDADDVVNTVDFRRKLLHFNQTNCGEDQRYNTYSIPRYYSSFYPWFKQCFQKYPTKTHCNVEYKRIQVNPPIVMIKKSLQTLPETIQTPQNRQEHISMNNLQNNWFFCLFCLICVLYALSIF